MIIMGVDFGDARTGLAVCDKTELIASRAGLVEGGFKKALNGTAAKAQELGAELIVVGNPINMDGSEGPRSQRCKDFASELQALSGIPVVLYDERLTTVDDKLTVNIYNPHPTVKEETEEPEIVEEV